MSALFNFSGSFVWAALNGLQRMLRAAGVLQARRLGVPVISVGNIQAGGSGKTPLVAHLATRVLARGGVPVVLMRGYQGERERRGGVLPPAGDSDIARISAREWGDEPALLHELVPQAWIGVGGDRFGVWNEKLRPAMAQVSPDLPARAVVILDDGFQHLGLERDLDIVAVTSDRPWDRLFREFPRSLRFADLLVWTKGERAPFALDDPRSITVRLQPPAPDAHESRQDWWLFTGLGDGGDARKSLESVGWRISRHVEFRDHARYHPEVLRAYLTEVDSQGARAITTSKDWVKWRELGIGTRDAVRVIEPRVLFTSGEEKLDRALEGLFSRF